ncbi:MAG: hypothetical protein JWP15_2346 [Alphaproteobacteria bacterium]|nr:hypothetical protein [Alphaproteobacteria bacterium]
MLIGLAMGAGILLGLLVAGSLRLDNWLGGPNPETVATASLQSMREQQRLTAFTARFVAVVTSSQSRLGLSSRKTTIMPGLVRYEIDLARLRQRDVRWDAEAKTLRVVLPPIEISDPQVNPSDIRSYGGGGLVTALTGGDARLDQANLLRGQVALRGQAREPMPMQLARDSARRAIERSFAMPLRAAGVDAKVAARFADEGTSAEQMDRSRSLEEVLGAGH